MAEGLTREDTRVEAAEIVRSLVTRIELTPEDGRLAITLHGDLASMLSFAAANKKTGAPCREAGRLACVGEQASVVAGGGFGREYALPTVRC